MSSIGKTTWVIPDMYWPEITSEGHYVSHEAICVLNMSDQKCELEITLYFEDREPVGDLKVTCEAKRTHHIRMDLLTDANGEHIPRGLPYASVIKASVPVVIQYTRVDTTQCANSIMTTMAYAAT
ncbi:MAG: sensory rhodopsin transducer [Bacillota bacterium]